jgi:phosphate transport system protein
LERCKKSITKIDASIATEVLEVEKRVNEMELTIDRDCENILALHQPVATDLRFVLSSMKISNDLERIGDNLKVFAKFLESDMNKNNAVLMDSFKFGAFVDLFIDRISDIKKSIKSDDSDIARKAIKNADILEKRKRATEKAADLIKEHPSKVKVILRLYALIQRMARIGSLTNNIAEEIIFYKDARVLKHHSKKA